MASTDEILQVLDNFSNNPRINVAGATVPDAAQIARYRFLTGTILGQQGASSSGMPGIVPAGAGGGGVPYSNYVFQPGLKNVPYNPYEPLSYSGPNMTAAEVAASRAQQAASSTAAQEAADLGFLRGTPMGNMISKLTSKGTIGELASRVNQAYTSRSGQLAGTLGSAALIALGNYTGAIEGWDQNAALTGLGLIGNTIGGGVGNAALTGAGVAAGSLGKGLGEATSSWFAPGTDLSNAENLNYASAKQDALMRRRVQEGVNSKPIDTPIPASAYTNETANPDEFVPLEEGVQSQQSQGNQSSPVVGSPQEIQQTAQKAAGQAGQQAAAQMYKPWDNNTLMRKLNAVDAQIADMNLTPHQQIQLRQHAVAEVQKHGIVDQPLLGQYVIGGASAVGSLMQQRQMAALHMMSQGTVGTKLLMQIGQETKTFNELQQKKQHDILVDYQKAATTPEGADMWLRQHNIPFNGGGHMPIGKTFNPPSPAILHIKTINPLTGKPEITIKNALEHYMETVAPFRTTADTIKNYAIMRNAALNSGVNLAQPIGNTSAIEPQQINYSGAPIATE